MSRQEKPLLFGVADEKAEDGRMFSPLIDPFIHNLKGKIELEDADVLMIREMQLINWQRIRSRPPAKY